jgi:beta-glucanase (GH16 family)
MRSVVANPWWGAAVYYTLSLSPTKLSVRTVNAPPGVAVRVTLSLRKGTASTTPAANSTTSSAPPAPSSSSTTTGGTTATTTTTTTTTPPPPPPPPPGPADPYGPYTTTFWEDNFAQDYVSGGSQPNQFPSGSSWGLDNWGSCGSGTLSQSSYSSQNTSLTSNGLAITAVANGYGGYSSAQVDSAGRVSFLPGTTIEARIRMPSGQGLCPAFWMLSDNPPPNQGEIDVVEAPSFGPSATTGFFDLHGPGAVSQQYESAETAAGSLAGIWHNYAVTWGLYSISWSMDGNLLATANPNSLTAGSSWSTYSNDGAYHLIFDLAVGGWPCADQPVGPSCSPPASATMYVQWVKAFH